VDCGYQADDDASARGGRLIVAGDAGVAEGTLSHSDTLPRLGNENLNCSIVHACQGLRFPLPRFGPHAEGYIRYPSFPSRLPSPSCKSSQRLCPQPQPYSRYWSPNEPIPHAVDIHRTRASVQIQHTPGSENGFHKGSGVSCI